MTRPEPLRVVTLSKADGMSMAMALAIQLAIQATFPQIPALLEVTAIPWRGEHHFMGAWEHARRLKFNASPSYLASMYAKI